MRARPEPDGDRSIDPTRRRLVGTAAAFALTACAGPTQRPASQPHAVPTIDLHSHAGRVIPARTTGFQRGFEPVADAMRAGGMDVICLAVVADTPVTRVDNGAVHAFRDPRPGELYRWALQAYARATALIAREQLAVVTGPASLAAATGRPSVIVASEGADFLEGDVDRVDEFHERFGLRHLQLTHYRVNELGDIQTVPAVHGGLTDFGRAVVRRCAARGIVVDVAHAPLATVRGVVEATDRPIVLSHTSLSAKPGPLGRVISPEHARLVAATGGVVGIWPPAGRFPTLTALAGGFRDMVDVIGVDHVGLGSDMLGLTGPSILPTYADLPRLRDALRGTGFSETEIAQLLGGNYARVFAAVVR